MAPFPETEIMTIKRLEVALRKNDFKLLKEGAYKLHEKFHGGFKFEYIDLLKEILSNANNTPSIPHETREVLVSTIEDILADKNEPALEQNRVSSLTSLSYSTKEETPELQVQMKTSVQSPFSAEPFKEFSTPKVVVNSSLEPSNVEPVEEKTKQIAVFWCEEVSKTPVNKYKQMISKLKEEDVSFKEWFNLTLGLSSLNSDISSIRGILDRLGNKKVDFVTNSRSAELINLKNENINLIPAFGFMNSFRCSNCSETALSQNSLILKCPKCSSPMFLDVYSSESGINLDYYNSSIVSLGSASIWLLIQPKADKEVFNLLKSALQLSSKVSEIFILDNDINNKESAKNEFLELKPDLKINISQGAYEEFFSSI